MSDDGETIGAVAPMGTASTSGAFRVPLCWSWCHWDDCDDAYLAAQHTKLFRLIDGVSVQLGDTIFGAGGSISLAATGGWLQLAVVAGLVGTTSQKWRETSQLWHCTKLRNGSRWAKDDRSDVEGTYKFHTVSVCHCVQTEPHWKMRNRIGKCDSHCRTDCRTYWVV